MQHDISVEFAGGISKTAQKQLEGVIFQKLKPIAECLEKDLSFRAISFVPGGNPLDVIMLRPSQDAKCNKGFAIGIYTGQGRQVVIGELDGIDRDLFLSCVETLRRNGWRLPSKKAVVIDKPPSRINGHTNTSPTSSMDSSLPPPPQSLPLPTPAKSFVESSSSLADRKIWMQALMEQYWKDRALKQTVLRNTQMTPLIVEYFGKSTMVELLSFYRQVIFPFATRKADNSYEIDWLKWSHFIEHGDALNKYHQPGRFEPKRTSTKKQPPQPAVEAIAVRDVPKKRNVPSDTLEGLTELLKISAEDTQHREASAQLVTALGAVDLANAEATRLQKELEAANKAHKESISVVQELQSRLTKLRRLTPEQENALAGLKALMAGVPSLRSPATGIPIGDAISPLSPVRPGIFLLQFDGFYSLSSD